MEFLSSGPIFVQIADYYERLIHLGVIAAGDFLPSVREVASDQGINPNTVARSFQLLAEKGLVTPIEKKGYLVKEVEKTDRENHLESTISSLMDEGYKKEEILSAFENIERTKK